MIYIGLQQNFTTPMHPVDGPNSNAISDRYHMRDFHATILHLLGLDQHKLFYLHNGRNEKLTDFGGTVIDKIFI